MTWLEKLARILLYNKNPYDPVSNPLGFDNDGYRDNLFSLMADYVDTVQEHAANMDMAKGTTASLNDRLNVSINPDGSMKNPAPAGGWWAAVAGAVRTGNLTFTVPSDLAPLFTAHRKVRDNAHTDFAVSSTGDAGGGLTTVTLTGTGTLATPLTSIEYGQEPGNAPSVVTGQPNGICDLDSSGNVPPGRLGNVPAPLPTIGSILAEYAIMGG